MTSTMNIELRFNGEAAIGHVLRAIEKAAADLERKGGISMQDMTIAFGPDVVTIAGAQIGPKPLKVAARGAARG